MTLKIAFTIQLYIIGMSHKKIHCDVDKFNFSGKNNSVETTNNLFQTIF